MPTVNLSNVSTKIEPLAGTFVLTVDGVEDAVSQKGNAMHRLTFSVAEVIECTAGNEETAIGRKIKDFIVLTQDSLWKLKSFMRAVGYEEEELDGEIEYESSDWLSHQVVTVLKIEEASGNYPARSRVSRYVVPKDETEEDLEAQDFEKALEQLANT